MPASPSRVASRYAASLYSLNDLAESLVMGQSGEETLRLLQATPVGQTMLRQYFLDVLREMGGDYPQVDLDGTNLVKGSGPSGHALFERGAVVLGLRLSDRGRAEALWRREIDGRFVAGSLPLFSLDKAVALTPSEVARALLERVWKALEALGA